MKILIISNMYPSEQKPYAGIFVKNQYEALLRNIGENDSIHIFAMQRTFTSSIGSILKYFKAFVEFTPHYFKKYDIIHLHFFYPFILLVYFYKIIYPETKIIVTFHGSDINTHINGGVNQKIFKYLSKCIDVPIAVGDDLAKEITHKLQLNVNEIISAGVDEKVFYSEALEKKYDFIFVGSFLEVKGFDLLVNAIKKINDINIRFCFVGSGKLEYLLSDIMGLNFKVFKNMSQDEIRCLYNQSRFLILPSRNDSFGLVVSEGMFCGIPAIVSNQGGVRAQVRNNFNGLIINNLTSELVASTISTAYNISDDDYNEMVDSALISNKEHSMESIISKLIKIYKND